MPHHKQFKKSLRKTEKSNLRNRAAKSKLATLIKKVRLAANKDEASQALLGAVSIIDSTAQKGIIKKQTAARKKSRLFKFVSKIA